MHHKQRQNVEDIIRVRWTAKGIFKATYPKATVYRNEEKPGAGTDVPRCNHMGRSYNKHAFRFQPVWKQSILLSPRTARKEVAHDHHAKLGLSQELWMTWAGGPLPAGVAISWLKKKQGKHEKNHRHRWTPEEASQDVSW